MQYPLSGIRRRGSVLLILPTLLLGCRTPNQSIEHSAKNHWVNVQEVRNLLSWTHTERDTVLANIEAHYPTHAVAPSSQPRKFDPGEALELQVQREGTSLTMGEYFEAQQAHGLAIIQQSKIRYLQYRPPVTTDSKWMSYSIAKAVTSTLIGVALADGSIHSVDDRITTYIPELRNTAYDHITLAHVLSMTSGIDWNEDYADPESDISKFQYFKPIKGNSSIEYLTPLKRLHEPGQAWNYNTGETDLLSVVLQRATGKTLSEYLSQSIWKNYGMAHEASWIVKEEALEYGGCCLSATLMDYARFGQFILDELTQEKSGLVAENWFEVATAKQAQINGDDYDYGYLWWIRGDGSFTAYGIFGQPIFIDPTRELVVVTLSNWPSPLDRERSAWREVFFSSIQSHFPITKP